MEEEVENKEYNEEFSESRKKYINIWRNKWITSRAGSIDDFIATYERLAEKMRRWKAMGIVLDLDIIASFGDDYAQFCTYDERIGIKEGFEEEIIEEYEEIVESELSKPSFLEFQINEYLTLKLSDKFIQIYVNEKPFNQCRYLLIIDPQKHEYYNKARNEN